LVTPLAAVLGALLISRAPIRNRGVTWQGLWTLLGGLAAGLWVFNAFRYAGFVAWPMGHPGDVAHYLFLLYCHVTLVVTVLACVLWSMWGLSLSSLLSWGQWGRTKHVLLVSAGAVWAWALYSVVVTPTTSAGGVTALLAIALVKACLTGIGEEAYYRGLLLPAAATRYGVPVGIVFQACVYTAFHVHLGPAFFGQAGFLAAVFALGLLFGTVTQRTRGIGWACMVHVALNMVIEWRNLS